MSQENQKETYINSIKRSSNNIDFIDDLQNIYSVSNFNNIQHNNNLKQSQDNVTDKIQNDSLTYVDLNNITHNLHDVNNTKKKDNHYSLVDNDDQRLHADDTDKYDRDVDARDKDDTDEEVTDEETTDEDDTDEESINEDEDDTDEETTNEDDTDEETTDEDDTDEDNTDEDDTDQESINKDEEVTDEDDTDINNIDVDNTNEYDTDEDDTDDDLDNDDNHLDDYVKKEKYKQNIKTASIICQVTLDHIKHIYNNKTNITNFKYKTRKNNNKTSKYTKKDNIYIYYTAKINKSILQITQGMINNRFTIGNDIYTSIITKCIEISDYLVTTNKLNTITYDNTKLSDLCNEIIDVSNIIITKKINDIMLLEHISNILFPSSILIQRLMFIIR